MRIKRTGDDCCGPWENIAQQIAAIWTAIYNKVGSVNGKLPVNNGELELTASDVDAYDKDETDGLLAQKQNVLTAGANITIEDDVISAEGGADYEAGTGIDITGDVISNTAPNEQADWNEADSDDPAYIRNKPSIPSVSDRVAFTTGSGAPSGTPTADGLLYFDTTNGYGYEAVNINGTRLWQRIGNAITQVAAIAPATTPTGLNMVYVDTLNNDIYISQFVYPDSYEWQKVADLTTVDSALDAVSANPVENSVVTNALAAKIGIASSGWDPPTTATVGVVGDIYHMTHYDDFYMCVAASGGTYTWKKIVLTSSTADTIWAFTNDSSGSITVTVNVNEIDLYDDTGAKIVNTANTIGELKQLVVSGRKYLNCHYTMVYNSSVLLTGIIQVYCNNYTSGTLTLRKSGLGIGPYLAMYDESGGGGRIVPYYTAASLLAGQDTNTSFSLSCGLYPLAGL